MANVKQAGKIKHGKDVIALQIMAYTFCTLIALFCLIPFIMVISGSFSSEGMDFLNCMIAMYFPPPEDAQ